MNKKKLNVYFSGNLVDPSIVKLLDQRFNVNLVTFSIKELNDLSIDESVHKLSSINLIIFTGGEDVNPVYYHQNTLNKTIINEKRDILEFDFLKHKLYHTIVENIPKLGICRGAQLLTVYNGGSLIQHVTGHNNCKDVIYVKDNIYSSKIIEVLSDHHQMMFPYDLPKSNYDLIGWSEHFKSNTYLNGDGKETILPYNFLEPEIIYYPKTNSLCIQSHPEWCIGTKGSDTCLDIIDNYLFKNTISKNKQEINNVALDSYEYELITINN